MYKAVIRDGFNEGEIIPYRETDLSPPARIQGDVASGSAADEESGYELVDFSELGPYLLWIAAQEKADVILTEAREHSEQLRKETLEQATTQGREEAKKDILPSLVAFADAGQALIVFEERLVTRYVPQLVQLALEIAEKVIGKAVVNDPEIVASILERAKREVIDARLIRIWLHPADVRTLSELRPDLVKTGEEGGRKIEVIASEEISRGGCRVETEIGIVDATIPTQIHEIRRQLLDEEATKASLTAQPRRSDG